MKIIAKRSALGVLAAMFTLATLASCSNQESSSNADMTNKASYSVETASPEQVRLLSVTENSMAPGLLAGGVTVQATNSFPSDNVVAPYDVSRLLGMIAAGARGATLGEFQTAMGYDSDTARWPSVFYTLDLAMQPSPQDATSFKTAAAWFGQTQYKFDQGYLDIMTVAYSAQTSFWDFAYQDPYFIDPLRSWVGTNTDNQLIPWLSIDDPSRARVVQSSASNLVIGWDTQHYQVSEFTGLFDRIDGSQIYMPMLNIDGILSTVKTNDFSAVKLPLVTPDWDLVVVTPVPDLFQQVERNLLDLLPQDGDWIEASGSVIIPAFTLHSFNNLGTFLQSAGLNLAFQEFPGPDQQRADFSGVNGQGFLFLADISTDAVLSVDMTGVRVAGSASAVLAATRDEPASVWTPSPANGTLTYGPCNSVYVKAGNADATPLLIAVRHKPTGSIVSLGRAVYLSGEEAGHWECL